MLALVIKNNKTFQNQNFFYNYKTFYPMLVRQKEKI